MTLMSYEELQKLEREASQMENSLTKVVVLEQAIKLADAMGDLEKGVSLRLDLVRAAMQSGVDDRALGSLLLVLGPKRSRSQSVSRKSISLAV
jgi:hypothetical protein